MKFILADTNKKVIDAWNEVDSGFEFVTTHHGSIFDVDCDAIVSPANSFGFMDGGLDRLITNYFGPQIQKKLQEKIQMYHNNELLVGQSEIVETNHSRIKYIIASPTMRVPMILKDTVNVYLAIKGLLNLLRVNSQIKTVALSGMGTGVGQLPPEIFTRQMNQAIIDHKSLLYPNSWHEAQEKHQDLYLDRTHKKYQTRDLQYKRNENVSKANYLLVSY